MMTWFELSRDLKEGDRVVFVEDYGDYPMTVVPCGTTATVVSNGLNEIYCMMEVMPDDEGVRAAYEAWDGVVQLGHGLNPGADMDDGSDEATAWHSASPLARLEVSP